MAGTPEVQVPAGTCLYDVPAGGVIGVQLEDEMRDAAHASADKPSPGWTAILVNTPWTATELYLADADGDPATAGWQSCRKDARGAGS